MLREVPSYDILELKPKKSKYCVGIPLLNEGIKIKTQLERMKSSGINDQYDVIIFDGGSVDGSTDEYFLQSIGVRTLLTKTGPGKQGAQFRMGFDYILNEGYDGVITIDGNNKDSVESIQGIADKLQSGIDFIQASRFIKGGHHENTPLARYIAVRLIHAPWISILSSFLYTDTTSGFRGISKAVLLDKKLNIFRNIFNEYELLFYMSAKIPRLGYKTIEHPVSRVYPNSGKTPTKISFFGNFRIIWKLVLLSVGKYNA